MWRAEARSGLGFRVWGLGFRVLFRVLGFGFRFRTSGFGWTPTSECRENIPPRSRIWEMFSSDFVSEA